MRKREREREDRGSGGVHATLTLKVEEQEWVTRRCTLTQLAREIKANIEFTFVPILFQHRLEGEGPSLVDQITEQFCQMLTEALIGSKEQKRPECWLA